MYFYLPGLRALVDDRNRLANWMGGTNAQPLIEHRTVQMNNARYATLLKAMYQPDKTRSTRHAKSASSSV